ncbi:SfnB family sulfur acquisition oxidoreductase [Williamsia phyllosphaerae]|uniref:Dibenzothiophene monooxygenase n=1 Tax=Williamsia phyllosphaerae TaxID=885042 RepID=A0ABQ1UCF5_9NOCA|nr:SfnB family sulfur acquisition oxidoreductase [Williamsia phyllosphaerae]GGF14486.1 SfnB family sulfur acquisition oxidoreductase [Williamsia phyllosphaerae]
MTAVAAPRIGTREQALDSARLLAARFGPGAAARDRDRRLPQAEIAELAASGLLAITVPVEYGGTGLPPSVVAEVFRILAAADPNIAQIPQSHFVQANLLRIVGTTDQRRKLFSHIVDGGLLANAHAERDTTSSNLVETRITPDGNHFRLRGTKFYCTGSLHADTLAVLARLDAPAGGLSAGEYTVFVGSDTDGVEIIDDWDGLGQRTSGSGTVVLDDVAVAAEDVIARHAAVDAPTGFGAFSQLLHAAIDTGIAAGALHSAVDCVRTLSRPWWEAGVERAVDDPLLIQRFGELSVVVASAEATLEVAGRAVDAMQLSADDPVLLAAEASVAVATAKVVSDRAANEVSSALFEVSGTRSAADDLNLHHFWRNARIHTLHDPVRWKYQHLGRYVLHGTPPPLSAII